MRFSPPLFSGPQAFGSPCLTSGPTFVTLRPRKRTLSTSDSEPTPRRAKSDFLSVFLSVAISYQLLVTLEGNMCGIIALYARRREVDPETVRRATASLRHRGPDGQRHWLSPDRRIGLGHARLSIIDLTTGDQPIASEDERTTIVVNGEFYGYEAIQKELERAGHRLRTRSDSEIALHLYEDLGPQCLHRLRGEFAFVIWDEANRMMFAARDRFGIKPLFYAMP